MIASSDLFLSLSEKDINVLTSRLKPRKYAKGDVIIAPGDIQKELFFIKSGVQMSFFETDHKTHVIAFTYPPNLCAIPESFSFQTPSTYFLTCLTDSEMDSITYTDLQEVLDQSHPLERLFRKMTEAVLAGMINRHIELQSLTMEQRYRAFCTRSPQLLSLVPHKYIASYLGMDATNFSKLYNSIRI